jgi:hypothetical protein
LTLLIFFKDKIYFAKWVQLAKGFAKLACPWAFSTVLDARLVRAEKIAKLLLRKDTIDLTQSRERNRA